MALTDKQLTQVVQHCLASNRLRQQGKSNEEINEQLRRETHEQKVQANLAYYENPARKHPIEISFDPLCRDLSRLFQGTSGMAPGNGDSNEGYVREKFDEDVYDRDAHFEELCARVPDSHEYIGELDYVIDHSPGLSWQIEQTYFVGPAENPEMEWILYCINWDDNGGVYEVQFLAECLGAPSPKIAAVAMLENLFSRWVDVAEADHPGWELVAMLKSQA